MIDTTARTTQEDTMNTTHADLDITATTAAGNSYQLAVYTDPFPGRKGDEVLKETCGKCLGDKVVHYGGLILKVNGVSGRVCFQCMGKGYTTRMVSSARSTARRQVKAENERRAAAADFAADYDRQLAAEIAEAHTEALEEEARRAALVSGFAAEVGVRLTGVRARVDVNAKFKAVAFNGYSTDYKSMLILTDLATGHVLKAVMGARNLERGQEVMVSGTVKAHDTYKGQDQTILARPIIRVKGDTGWTRA